VGIRGDESVQPVVFSFSGRLTSTTTTCAKACSMVKLAGDGRQILL
jgi:hypothetical protein